MFAKPLSPFRKTTSFTAPSFSTKSHVLTGAEAVNSTPLFEPWYGPGEVYYKIRDEAIAPRHFLDSTRSGHYRCSLCHHPGHGRPHSRQGGRRLYRVRPQNDSSFRRHRRKKRNERNQGRPRFLAAGRHGRGRCSPPRHERRTRSPELHPPTRGRIQSTQPRASQRKRNGTGHCFPAPRTRAPRQGTRCRFERLLPFQSAATLKTLPAHAEVVILIVTPHWLGIETPEGQRGWLPVEQLEPLP